MKKSCLLLLIPLLMVGCSNNGDFSNEDNMKLDATYKEQYGEPFYRLYHQNNEESNVYADMYSYFGENGLHTYIYVHDNIINYVSQKAVYYNSSIELFINDIKKFYIDNKSIQYRIAAGGKYTKLCGVRSKTTWTSSYFDGSFKTKIDGEVNTNTCKGYAVETFVPYYELGIKDRDSCKGMMITLAMNRVPTTSQDQTLTFRQRTMRNMCYQATPYTWIPIFKNESNTAVEGFAKSEFFGRHQGIDVSYGFEFEKEDGIEKGKNSKVSNLSIAMVKKEYNPTHYYYQTRIKNLDGTGSPKAGLFTNMGRNKFILYLRSLNHKRVGVVQRNANNSGWDWDVGEGKTYINDFDDNNSNIDLISNEGALLALYRHNDTFAFFVNNELYFATQDVVINGKTFTPKKLIKLNYSESEVEDFYEESSVGMVFFTSTAAFSQYDIHSNEKADEMVYGLLNK